MAGAAEPADDVLPLAARRSRRWSGLYDLVDRALIVTVPISWFALLFTGRYPRGALRASTPRGRATRRTSYGYCYLGTDRWPGFSGSPDVDYPGAPRHRPAAAGLQPAKVGLRIILMIPSSLIAYAMKIVAQIAAFIAWFAIVFTGKQPRGHLPDAAPGPELQAARAALLPAADRGLAVVHRGRRAAGAGAGAAGAAAPPPPAGGAAPQAVPRQSDAPPNLGDFRPPAPPDDAA